MSTIETTDKIWAGCRIPNSIITGAAGVITGPSSTTPPDFPANYPAAGIKSVTKVAVGLGLFAFMIELEQAASDVELLGFATLHGFAGSTGGAAVDSVVGEISIPATAQNSIEGGTKDPTYFRQVVFTQAAQGPNPPVQALPVSADVYFLHLPFTGQYST
ncbi:MAG: hypothetical protein ACHREM_15065 [Polyangiales bacterium]